MTKNEKLSQNNIAHCPVLAHEVIEYLNVRPGLVYVDATCGMGGHLSLIWEKIQELKPINSPESINNCLIGIDQDSEAIEFSKQRLSGKALLIKGNFAQIKELLKHNSIENITGGLIADLGVSSYQLDCDVRGFSFTREARLDMRMDATKQLDAHFVVNNYTLDDLSRIILEYGQEPLGKLIAKKIIENRPINTTLELASIINKCYLRIYKTLNNSKINPATRTFQAIRIEVNNELENIKQMLSSAQELLSQNARLVVISFHGLEDKIVKDFFKNKKIHVNKYRPQNLKANDSNDLWRVITPKPILPTAFEVLANNRARSAKLRAVEKL